MKTTTTATIGTGKSVHQVEIDNNVKQFITNEIVTSIWTNCGIGGSVGKKSDFRIDETPQKVTCKRCQARLKK